MCLIGHTHKLWYLMYITLFIYLFVHFIVCIIIMTSLMANFYFHLPLHCWSWTARRSVLWLAWLEFTRQFPLPRYLASTEVPCEYRVQCCINSRIFHCFQLHAAVWVTLTACYWHQKIYRIFFTVLRPQTTRSRTEIGKTAIDWRLSGHAS